ncbi:response regulator [Paenibacillus sp. MAH-36]|uniref:Response regulator n=1 Tax=Paenibacillus violae TaxID=3077234 RepID=A0ABU3R8J4_9BACL|nr:response regulator [Paenibacillus sp. PFR10]MDU0200575.1 response regulator [Paenibacillus sp. PFR10]
MKLMVVDDEPILLNGIIRMIEKANTSFTEIVGASDGIDALHKLATFQPDLILTDIHMPEMDGLALIKEVQAQHFGNRFVIITGYDDFAYARQALRYQVVDYLLKPINKVELVGVLEKVEQTIRIEQRQMREHDLLMLKEHLLYDMPYEDMPLKPEQLHTLLPDPFVTMLVFQPDENTPMLTAERLKQLCNQLSEMPFKAYSFQSRFLRQTVVILNGMHVPTEAELQVACGDLLESKSTPYIGLAIGGSGRKMDIDNLRELYMEAVASMLFNRHFANCSISFYRRDAERMGHELALAQESDRMIALEQIAKEMQALHLHLSDCDHQHIRLRELVLSLVSDHNQKVGTMFDVANHSKLTGQLLPFERRPEHSQPHTQAIDKIVSFVEQNYKLDLSLDVVADHVQMHPNYISMLFRKEMDLTFLHYLHTFRLTKAKQFMQDHPDWPINTIAELVGYENPRHFFKVFKKFENTTPGQYRLGSSSI